MARKLTDKQEAFVLAYLETADEDQAYRMAYDAEGMSGASIQKEAKRLKNHPLVAPRLQKVDLMVQVKGLRSLEDHISKLEELRDAAIENGQIPAAVKAEELIGKVSRLYVIQVEHGEVGEFSRMSDEELQQHVASEVKELKITATRH